MDSHVHYVCPQQGDCALCSNGVTTLFGGGIGPTDGTNGTTMHRGQVEYRARMLEACERPMPVNMGILGKGHCSTTKSPLHRPDRMRRGHGFKIHEDWGATPAVIRAAA